MEKQVYTLLVKNDNGAWSRFEYSSLKEAKACARNWMARGWKRDEIDIQDDQGSMAVALP